MIYVQYLTKEDFTIYSDDNNSGSYSHYFIKIPDLSRAWALVMDGSVKYGVVNENNILKLYGHVNIESSNDSWIKASKAADTLPEGWYINYMGQIYDWKGNIVE